MRIETTQNTMKTPVYVENCDEIFDQLKTCISNNECTGFDRFGLVSSCDGHDFDNEPFIVIYYGDRYEKYPPLDIEEYIRESIEEEVKDGNLILMEYPPDYCTESKDKVIDWLTIQNNKINNDELEFEENEVFALCKNHKINYCKSYNSLIKLIANTETSSIIELHQFWTNQINKLIEDKKLIFIEE